MVRSNNTRHQAQLRPKTAIARAKTSRARATLMPQHGHHHDPLQGVCRWWRRKMNRKFGGKKIWVIGGSRGMGLALAKILAAAGARVIVSARTDSRHHDFPHQFLPLDVSNIPALKRACQSQKDLDGVIYMSGLHQQSLVADMDERHLLNMVAVNIQAPTLVAKWLGPVIQHRRGFFAICGSQTSFVGAPLGQPYSATKAYLKNLVETLAMELDRASIYLLAPGFVRTDLVKSITMPMPFTLEPAVAALGFAKGLAGGVIGQKMVIEFPFIITLFPPLWHHTPLWLRRLLWRAVRNKIVTPHH